MTTESMKYKLWGTLIAVLVSLYVLTPSFFDFRDRVEDADEAGREVPSYIKFFPEKSMNLGLDLRGGLYLEMDVDLDRAVDNRIDVLITEMERFYGEDYPSFKIERKGKKQVHLSVDKDQHSKLLNDLKRSYGDVFETVDSKDITGQVIDLELAPKYIAYLNNLVLKQAVEAVQNRIDRFGVSEAAIQRQGESRLIIELPGVKDPDRVIDVVRKTGQLEFKLIDETMSKKDLEVLVANARTENNIKGYSEADVKALRTALAGKIPENTELVLQLQRDPVTKEILNANAWLAEKKTSVTGGMLRNAQVNIVNNEPYVNLSFNRAGKKNFADLTKNNVGRSLAIILDGFLSSAPRIQEAIPNGEARITLGFGDYNSLLREAEDLALVLREGALPASLSIATKTVIGPSLGADSIRKGLLSLFIAAGVVMLFMIVYYKWGGFVSTLGLILNVLFIFAILAVLQASLTLPGMAGIVLTLGMAVDANIIIYERMKEELALGRTPKSVVESGFGNAMSAIIDANITTFIAGVVLFQFGTGPIKGFATTLMIGIVTTLITAVYFTRIVFDFYVYRRNVKKLSI